MAKRTFSNRDAYVAAVHAMGLTLIKTQYAEEFAHGSEGNFGCGMVTTNDGSDGCETSPCEYYAVLYDTAAEFDDYAYSEDGFAMPPMGCPTTPEDLQYAAVEAEDKAARRKVSIYPLTGGQLNDAAFGCGYTEPVRFVVEPFCTQVYVDHAGKATAVYEYTYYDDDEEQYTVGRMYVTAHLSNLYVDF